MIGLSIEDPVYFEHLGQVERDHWWSRGMWRIASGWLDRALRDRPGLLALDIGCGAGGTLRRLATRNEIEHVVGLDPSPDAVRQAAGWDLCLGSALDLPFAKDSIDVVTCFDVLQHLPTGGDRLALRELARVLKPRGIAILRTNGRGIWHDSTASSVPYRRDQLAGTARETGLIVRRSTYANCLPAIASEVLGRFVFRKSQDFGHPQGRGLRIRAVGSHRNRLMLAISVLEAFAITKLGASLPVGHSTMMLVEKPGGSTP